MDHGLFAFSNFLLNILLARWLPPRQLGTYALAFSVFLLFATVHTALLTQPMLVFGPARYRDFFKRYLETLITFHWWLTFFLGTLFALAGLVIHHLESNSDVGKNLIAVALVSPFILLQWFLRRACYVRMEPRIAVLPGVAYMFLMSVGAFLLFSTKMLSAVSAFILMGSASLVSALWIARRLSLRITTRTSEEMLVTVKGDHWGYGRWAVGAAALTWVPLNIFFFLLPLWGGLNATAAFRALNNLLLPAIHLFAAFGPVLLPAFVTVRGNADFGKRVKACSVAFLGGGLLYWLLLVLLGEPIVEFLYVGKYAAYSQYLPILAAAMVPQGLALVAGEALRAIERPDLVFRAWAASGSVALLSGLLLVPRNAVWGASVGLLLSSIVVAGVMNWLLWKAEKSLT